eukprot:4613788-Pyramimonas_sp.AAC.1
MRSNITGKSTRALTNGRISRTKFSTEPKSPKGSSRFFLPTSSPAPGNYSYWAPAVNRQPWLPPGNS